MTIYPLLARVMGPHDTLKLECPVCSHRAEWPRWIALQVLGPDATPFDVRRRIKCGACGDTERVKAWV